MFCVFVVCAHFLSVDYCPSIVYPGCGDCCVAMTRRKQWAWGRGTATAWFRTDTATPQEEEGEAAGWRECGCAVGVKVCSHSKQSESLEFEPWTVSWPQTVNMPTVQTVVFLRVCVHLSLWLNSELKTLVLSIIPLQSLLFTLIISLCLQSRFIKPPDTCRLFAQAETFSTFNSCLSIDFVSNCAASQIHFVSEHTVMVKGDLSYHAKILKVSWIIQNFAHLICLVSLEILHIWLELL